MKVGIDLSSTNTGLVILSDENKLIFHDNFQLWDNNRFMIVDKVNEMIDYIELKNPFHKFIMIGIELADFKNANITNRFNLLAGMIISELSKMKAPEPIDDDLYLHLVDPLKIFNSNEWQRFIWDINLPLIESRIITINGNKKQQFRIKSGNCRAYPQVKWDTNNWSEWLDKRGILKLLSRMWTHENCVEYIHEWTEDECDAYCIAYFLPQLRDRTQMHQEVKAKKVQANKSKVQELRAKASKEHKISKLKDIVIKYKSMSKLTKAQQRALEKAENELKELK